MSDIKLTAINGRYDINIAGGEIEKTDGLDTAIWVSLFSDARADASIVPVPENRRGWPIDLVNDVQGRQLGGFLWLIDQRRLTQKTLNEAIDYARKALSWMVEDGIALSIAVTGSIVPRSGISLVITIEVQSGKTTRYVNLWEETVNAD